MKMLKIFIWVVMYVVCCNQSCLLTHDFYCYMCQCEPVVHIVTGRIHVTERGRTLWSYCDLEPFCSNVNI